MTTAFVPIFYAQMWGILAQKHAVYLSEAPGWSLYKCDRGASLSLLHMQHSHSQIYIVTVFKSLNLGSCLYEIPSFQSIFLLAEEKGMTYNKGPLARSETMLCGMGLNH